LNKHDKKGGHGKEHATVELARFEAMERLQTFDPRSHAEQLFLVAAASQINTKEVRELEKMFLELDTKHRGALGHEEIAAALRTVGKNISDVDARKLCEKIDLDGNGTIEYSEFLAATVDGLLANKDQACWRAFKMFDLDGSGFIEIAELVKLLGSDEVKNASGHCGASEDVIRGIYAELDTNSDGQVDYDEFVLILHRLQTRDQ